VADDLAKEIKKEGGQAIGVSADVLNAQQLNEAIKAILDQFGGINILVNGAGGNMLVRQSPPIKHFLI
jgi:NAD(P)-dependent dehydrogenase (short-subunit alcohol dehydrogenase family)